MSLVDEQRSRVAVNQAVCEFLQRPRDALVGRRMDDIFAPSELTRLEADGSDSCGSATGPLSTT
jgi:PAS domain-containing protein